MPTIDMDPIIEQIVADLAQRLRPVIAETVRAALDERAVEQLLDSRALARYLSCSTAALRMRLKRGSDLKGITLTVDGKRVWRRSDVDALAARGRPGR